MKIDTEVIIVGISAIGGAFGVFQYIKSALKIKTGYMDEEACNAIHKDLVNKHNKEICDLHEKLNKTNIELSELKGRFESHEKNKSH